VLEGASDVWEKFQAFHSSDDQDLRE
jgi:hypothetical protein